MPAVRVTAPAPVVCTGGTEAGAVIVQAPDAGGVAPVTLTVESRVPDRAPPQVPCRVACRSAWVAPMMGSAAWTLAGTVMSVVAWPCSVSPATIESGNVMFTLIGMVVTPTMGRLQL